MEHRPSILAHNYEHKVFSLINHRLTIQEAHSALWAWPFSKIFPVMAFSGPPCCEKQLSNDNI